MIQFLQPIWIIGFTGIALPVIIHLWNVKKGKTLKVGNIDFLIKNSASGIGKKLSDLLLFLIRCLLVLMLMFLLMEPFFESQDNTSKQKGWLLIPKNDIAEAYRAFPKTIDSLLAQGYQFHLFEKNFAEGSLSDSSKQEADSVAYRAAYWVLLKELDQQLPSSLPVFIFSAAELQHFKGNRPIVALSLQWKTFRSRNDSSIKSPIASSTTICIFSDNPAAGAKYVQAAIGAISNNTKHAVKVSAVTNIQNIPQNTDWLFWLSENNLPGKLFVKNLFLYQHGKPTGNYSTLVTQGSNNLSNSKEPELYKWVAHQANPSFTAVWTNSFGESILDKEVVDGDTTYHFYSRFNPQWNSIVWNDKFPQLLYDLILDASGEKNAPAAVTPLESEQVFPSIAKENELPIKKYRVSHTDLVFGAWLILFFLFAAERIISFRTKNREVTRG